MHFASGGKSHSGGKAINPRGLETESQVKSDRQFGEEAISAVTNFSMVYALAI